MCGRGTLVQLEERGQSCLEKVTIVMDFKGRTEIISRENCILSWGTASQVLESKEFREYRQAIWFG